MPLSNIVYPITESGGVFSNNIFPSQQPLNFTARRIDQTINSITSGTDGVVRINTLSPLTGVGLGDFVAFGTDSYSARTSLVINVIDPNTIEVDEVFTSANVTNSFINYLKDYFLEIRYVQGDSASDDQSALEVIKDFSQIPNNVEGNIQANISVPADLIEPSIVTTTQEVPSLSVSYKIQYRESFQGNRAGTWISPTVDAPILLVHAASSAFEGFTDTDLTKIYARDYPLYYSYIKSSINDTVNEITITLRQYDITKTVISETQEASLSNLNGVVLVVVTPDKIDSNAVFIEFVDSIVSSGGQYDPSDFDPGQYA